MQFGFNQSSGFREDFKTTESEGPRPVNDLDLLYFISPFSRLHKSTLMS